MSNTSSYAASSLLDLILHRARNSFYHHAGHEVTFDGGSGIFGDDSTQQFLHEGSVAYGQFGSRRTERKETCSRWIDETFK